MQKDTLIIYKDISDPMQETVGIRRNIQALNPAERQQYFWCLKMLGILPPFEAMKERYFWTLGTPGDNQNSIPYNQIQPTCLHDQLIANHATCCEHRSFFFAYYHRHLMFHLQMRLNYADECLRLTPQNFQKKFPQLYNNQTKTLWDAVLAQYKTIAPVKRKVMAHYWNPTNYNNRDDLVVPVELSDPAIFPEHKLDKIDQLYRFARDSYPYEINVKTRWYNNPQQFQSQRSQFIQGMISSQYFYTDAYSYTDSESNMIKGLYNARNNQDFQTFLQAYIGVTAFQTDGTVPNSFRVTGHRNYLKFLQSKYHMSLLYQNQGQILVNYAGRFNHSQAPFNFQYLNVSQFSGSRQDGAKTTYNKMLPHYQLGQALLSDQRPLFIDYLDPMKTGASIQASHSTMHNNMHFSMADGLFSLTNLLFFPYHSWIDVQLQMKVRLSHHAYQAFQANRFLSTFVQRKEYFDPILNPKGGSKTRGSYPIIEWANPRIVLQVIGDRDASFQQKVKRAQDLGLTQKDIKKAFPAKNFYLRNQTQIRTSLQLKEFYDQYYIPQNASLFSEFQGFKTFDASYDYEIFQTIYDSKNNSLNNVTMPLGDYPKVNIPSYLTAMKNQVNGYVRHLQNRVETLAIRQLSATPQQIQRLVDKNLLLLFKYRSSIPNGTYVFNANLERLATVIKERGYKLSEDEQICLKGDITIFVLSHLGKSNNASKCINCGTYKYTVANMNKELFDRYPRLWSLLSRVLNEEVIYDNRLLGAEKKSEDDVDVSRFIEITNLKNYFQTSYLQGAQEVTANLQVISDTGKISQFYFQLSLDVKRVQNGKKVSKAMKKISYKDLTHPSQANKGYTFKFDFYNLIDNQDSLKRSQLDGLVYSRVTGSLFVDGVSHSFSFKIRNYHEIMKYNISVSVESGKVFVKVVDADLQTKLFLCDAK